VVKNIKFERLSPHQGITVNPRSTISGYGTYDTLRHDRSNLTQSGM